MSRTPSTIAMVIGTFIFKNATINSAIPNNISIIGNIFFILASMNFTRCPYLVTIRTKKQYTIGEIAGAPHELHKR